MARIVEVDGMPTPDLDAMLRIVCKKSNGETVRIKRLDLRGAQEPIFKDFLGIFGIFGQILRFLIKITWFLSFSSKNDAESLCHFVKIPFLDQKRAKLDQNFDFGHVRTYSWLHNLRNTQGKIYGT